MRLKSARLNQNRRFQSSVNLPFVTLRLPFKSARVALFCAGLTAAGAGVQAPATQAQTLFEALEAAYRSNPSILALRQGQQATDEGVAQAKATWRPIVTLSGELERNYSNSFPRTTTRTDASWYTSKTAGLSVSQTLYNGGKTDALVSQAEAVVKAGVAGLLVTEQNIFLGVVEAYLNLVRDQATVLLNTNNIDVLEKQLKATQDRFLVGEITKTDVAQAEARLAGSIADRESSLGSLARSLATFEQLVGEPAVNVTTPTTLLDLPSTLDEAVATALEVNPSLMNSMAIERAAEQGILSEYADILPTVALEGSLSRALDASTADDRTTAAAVGVSVSVPLYQGGAAHSEIREARKTLNQRKIEVEEVRRTVIEGVKSAWEGLQTARALIESRNAQVEAAEIALDGVRQEEEVGARTPLDVLDAEQELLDAQVALVSAVRDENVAAYNLLASMGKLHAEALGLEVDIYDPTDNFNVVKDQWFGWDTGE